MTMNNISPKDKILYNYLN